MNEIMKPVYKYDKISVAVISIFFLYVVTWFMQLGNRISALNEIRFEMMLASTLLLISIVNIRKYLPHYNPLFPYVLLYFLSLIIQIPFSYDYDRSLDIFINRVLKFSVLAIFIIFFLRSPKALKYFIAVLMLVFFKMGQEGLLGTFTGSLIWENQGIPRLHGVTGLYRHPNSFSGMALGTLPFIYYLFPIAPFFVKVFFCFLLAFSTNIIIFTGSRTGYIGTILFSTYVFMKSTHKIYYVAIIAIVIIILFNYIPNDYINRLESIVTLNEAEGNSSQKRLVILKDSWEIFKQYPFGVGISAFMKVRTEIFGRQQDTHNLYLEILTNLGIQGMFVWLLMIFQLFKQSNYMIRSITSQIHNIEIIENDNSINKFIQIEKITIHLNDLKLLKAVLLAVKAYIVIRLSVGLFGHDLYEIYWWLALGIVIATHNIFYVSSRISNEIIFRHSVQVE